MSEVIRKWITNRIGLVMNMTPEIFAADVMDGTILARILHSYNIIGQDQLLSIVPTENSGIALRNLRKLKLWLQTIDIPCTDQNLLDICYGISSSGVKLFYQVYLALYNKDNLFFVAKKRGQERLHPCDTRFEIVPVPVVIHDPSIISDHPLSEPLVLRKDVVEWNRIRYQTMKEDFKEMREKYSRYIQEKMGIQYRNKFGKFKFGPPQPEQVDNLNEKFPDNQGCCGYEELLEQEKATLEMETFKEDPKVAKKIVNTIKQKHRKEFKENELKKHQQKLLLYELWENVVKQQEKEFEENISKKMLKQSLFEKQMATKMMEVRQQKQTMLENRRFLDEETMKKREAEFVENVFLRNKSISDQKYNYYFERARALELHRRLYAEKLRLKAERHFNMCHDVMNDLVDISVKYSEYKEKFDEEVPRRVQNEWANLFIKQQPIFDILDDIEDIVQDINDLPEEIEEIYRAELDRQNKLDQADFDNYFYLEWPWEPQEILTDFEEKSLLTIELGMNVLGHNVHRVLLTKYPKPKPPSKPDIPKPNIAACINGLPDTSILPVLQKLLTEKGVKVIEMEEAINLCLTTFKNEIETEYIDNVLIQETEAALQEQGGKKGKGKDKSKKGSDKSKKGSDKSKKGAKGKGSKQKKPVSEDSLAKFPKFAEKQSQTPRIYPCEEIVLSPKGELGKIAYDLLNIGEQLTDNLVVAMFVEYLKTLKDIKGWALINFPTTMTQAALLEESLTGIPIPGISKDIQLCLSVSIGDIADLEYRESQLELEEENAKLRKSRILPNPGPLPEEPFYDSYLTAYIHAQPKIDPEEKLKLKKNDNMESKFKEETGTEAKHFQEGVEEGEEEEEEKLDPLETFYMDQGSNYAFYYKTFELATIKHLAKLIIGEYTIPPKTSLELFGDTVLYIQANLGQEGATPGNESKDKKKGNKKEKPPKKEKGTKASAEPASKKGGSEKGKKGGSEKGKKGGSEKGKKGGSDKGGKKGKGAAIVEIVAVAREDKETQMPEIEPEVEEPYVELPPEPRAGEYLWRYTDIPFPDFFQIALATFWEKAEDVYVCDLKELFFIKRIILNAVIPYLTYVKKHMEIFIARPDNKQTHLYQFQKLYNEIDADLRDDDELKAEIHCRIAEFREKLWEICDRRMRESEAERQRIIQENWVTTQVAELTNNCITAMQLETDRCCDSLQFLTDYYTGVITKMPSEEPPLQKSMLNRLESRKRDSIISYGETAKEATTSILTVPHSESTSTPFHQTLEHTLDTATRNVAKLKGVCLGVIAKMETMFRPKTGKKDKSSKAKSSSKKGKDEKKLPKFVEPDPDVKEVGERLIEEWYCAVNGEMLRVKLRLDLLLSRGKQELDEVLNASKKTFYTLFTNIHKRYTQEMHSVDMACEVLAAAVEAEVPLQPELILEGDKFYVEPNVLLFPEPLPIPEPPLKEKELEGAFTLFQLDMLTNILMDLAPKASIPERAFVFLLQDMIVQNAEDGKPSMVPFLWKRLYPKQVSELFQKLFGKVEFIDWKDFIIYNLCIDFPSEEELLKVREQFRECDPDSTETVKDYQFYNIHFWFDPNLNENEEEEEDPEEMLRLRKIKELLFKLYRVNEDTLNYTALLFAFCKSHNPIKGFAKALTLALGKFVCWDVTIGQTFVENLKEQRFLDAQAELQRQHDHAVAVECAESVISSLIDKSVHLCDSVVIEDYVEEEAEENFDQIKSEDRLILEKQFDQNRTESPMNIEFSDAESKGMEELYKTPGESSEADSKEPELLMDESFSNIEIGFQPYYDPPKVYFLPFEALLTVMTASLPWHARAQTENDQSFRERVEVIYENLRDPEFGNTVLTHQLLNDKFFKRLLLSNFKFIVRNPLKIVNEIVGEPCDVCECE